MQNVYAYYLKAKQKSGKPSLFIYFEAKNDARALRDLENKIEDAELDPKEYFKPVRTDFPVFDDLPTEGEFCEKWCDRYCLGENGQTWEQIATEAGQQLSQKTTKSPAKDEAMYFAKDFDRHTISAAVWLLGRDSHQMTKEQLQAATALLMDDAQRYPQNVIMALSNIRIAGCTFHEAAVAVIAAMKTIWPPFDKAPELGKLSQFATEYLSARVEDRQSIISKWQTAPTAAPAPKPELPRTSTGALAGTGEKPAYGTPTASFAELETVVYLAHFPSDFNIGNPPGSIINAVGEAKKRKDKSPVTWFGMLRETPGILDFSREAIGLLIRNAPENIHMTPGALRSYINANLIEIDEKTAKAETHAQTQPLPQSETCSLADEQHSNETLAGATASAGDAALAGELTNHLPSFEGEKEEVDAIEDLEPTTRYAWLRREILAALEGKTSVMGVDDVKELVAKTGDLNHAYLARLLAKEIEPCDPFKQLAADEVHHLTCDVLESWTNSKEESCQFINERVEYYLSEKSKGNGVSDTESGSLKKVGKGLYDVSTLFAESPLAGVVVDGSAAANDVREFLDTPKEEPAQNDTPTLADTQPEEPEVTDEQLHFEPGRYTDIRNDAYHAANGISSTMLKDSLVSLLYYFARHVEGSIARQQTEAFIFGSLLHLLVLEPEKLESEFSIEPLIPEGAFTDTASMRTFIDKHNASLPKMTDSDTLRAVIEEYNATLPTPHALGGNAEEIGQFYTLLPVGFQRIGEDQKPTATAMKACIKEYNATLPTPLKTSGSREALLEQLAIIDPEFVKLELAIPAPLAVSGSKEDMAARIKSVLPNAVFADELFNIWRSSSDQRQKITQQQMLLAKEIQRALFNHSLAGPMLLNPQRATEVSYFGVDEETGLEVRIRPDLEIDTGTRRIAIDLKTVSMPYVKQDNLRYRLHREIIERDYHMSAGMYCDVGMFDQFFWIFVNKEPGYHWVAVVEASTDELDLGRAIYKRQLRAIRNAMDTGIWPEPITEVFTDTLTEYELSQLKELSGATL
ncbi:MULTISPECIES: RecE family exodeoxyribonuclease [unclassified Serratia (in: enterobacteria)]|uniref:RecE family exodeoxyribonuclease n=1 Tax=unclassified Serratia (in: enterobacteria) TaxID=2647522 RepID=UPI000690BE27|nr:MULTISPECIES: RecE family exodeoxyribonuclease [unclassified Serratia (in: enterobacteria)]